MTHSHVAPFFALNDDLQEDRLRERVRESVAAGFDGIILHARPGLRTPYLSDAWFEAIGFCIDEAKRHGLAIWLYDEYPWPSGAAGGRVIQRNSDFAEKYLSIQRFPLRGGQRIQQPVGSLPVLAAFILPASSAADPDLTKAQVVTNAIGPRNTTWITRDWDSRYYYLPKYVERYDCRRAMEYLTEQVFQGEVADGDWELIVFVEKSGSDYLEPFGDYVDLSNAAATAAFLEETHERYRSHFGAMFGTDIRGIFTDEPKYRNPLPWSRSIADAWSAFQSDPRALLALLPEGGNTELRTDYRQVTARLFGTNWVGPIRDWCRREKLKFIGHISPEEDWWSESRSVGSILANLREFSIPGCDLIIPAAGDRLHSSLNLTPTMAVSAAAQNGAPHALCEVFGCSDFSLDMQTIKRVGDWLMVSGINFLVPHACFYSLAGPRRFDAPPTFLPPSTNHPFLAAWSDDVRLTAANLGPDRPVDCAIVRPIRWMSGLADNLRDQAVQVFEEAISTAQHLLENGIAFHWVDDTDLPGDELEGETLRVGKATYSKLIVWKHLLPEKLTARMVAKPITMVSPSEARSWTGPIACKEGDVRGALGHDGRWFCVNLSQSPRQVRVEETGVLLAGYESRWIETVSVPSPAWQSAGDSVIDLHADWLISPPVQNVFRLKNWLCNGVSQSVGPAYNHVLEAREYAPTVYGNVPNESTLATATRLIYETNFHWGTATPPSLKLCIEEGGIEGPWQIFLNGTVLAEHQKSTDWANGLEYELVGAIRSGLNQLRIEITATDAREGLWLEPYLRGGFVVGNDQVPGCASGPIRGNDWSLAGYPHFSGTMEFSQSFECSYEQASEPMELVFSEPPHGSVEVILNGKPQGALLWSPWRLALPDLLIPGKNDLVLSVTNSLENFIYGKASPSGPGSSVQLQALASDATVGKNDDSSDFAVASDSL